MILNVWTVAAAFLAAVGAALGLVAAVLAVRGLFGLRGDATPAREASEERAHLLALVLGALLVLRGLAWPQFYLLLESYVPALAGYGAMCAFGVTRVQPELVAALQWAKPALVLGLGFWMLLAAVDRRAGRPALVGARFALAAPLALLALAECVAELAYLVREKVGRPVTCCTQFLETAAARPPESAPPPASELLGGGATPYFLLGALLVAGALALRRARVRPATRLALATALALLALLDLALTRALWTETLAPHVLGLPYHRCVYELLTDAPLLGLAAALAVLGHGALWWPLGLAPFRRASPEAVAAVQRAAYGFAAWALASSMTVVGIHLL